MKYLAVLLFSFLISLQGIAQDTAQEQDTGLIKTFYTSGRNFNIDAIGFQGTHKEDTTYVSGFGFHTFMGYQIKNINIGLGSGLEKYKESTYIPIFAAVRGIIGSDELRFFFFLDYGFLTGKPFGNFYPTGQFGNLGVGFSFFLSNYQTLNISAGITDIQLDKSSTPRDTRRDLMFLVKVGYSVY